MTYYETILIVRPGSASNTRKLIRMMGNSIVHREGVIRGVKILGDRIMSRRLFTKRKEPHWVGRYIQILHDNHPSLIDDLRKEAKQSDEFLFMEVNKGKDFMDEGVAYRRAA